MEDDLPVSHSNPIIQLNWKNCVQTLTWLQGLQRTNNEMTTCAKVWMEYNTCISYTEGI